MRFLGQTEDQVDIRVSVDELTLLRTTLNEMCNSMHFTDNDFLNILGVPRMEAEALLRRITGVLDRLRLDLARD